ncbi:MAG: YdjY domain-containing protein [Phycisphaerales bacterium]
MITSLLTVLLLLGSIAPDPLTDPLMELLPGVFVSDHVVEFEGTVAIDVHHPDTPIVYLEMVVTAPDSREHESLVVTSITPSSLHAALLAADAQPGKPRHKDEQGQWINATGDSLEVSFAIKSEDHSDQWGAFFRTEEWVVNEETKAPLLESEDWGGFVFAGSTFSHAGRQTGYRADRTGTIISLTTFGDEVISPTWSISDKAEQDTPEWIANIDRVPPIGTPVRVQIRILDTKQSHEPERIDIDRDG